jgi:hypothetical protein
VGEPDREFIFRVAGNPAEVRKWEKGDQVELAKGASLSNKRVWVSSNGEPFESNLSHVLLLAALSSNEQRFLY